MALTPLLSKQITHYISMIPICPDGTELILSKIPAFFCFSDVVDISSTESLSKTLSGVQFGFSHRLRLLQYAVVEHTPHLHYPPNSSFLKRQMLTVDSASLQDYVLLGCAVCRCRSFVGWIRISKIYCKWTPD